MATAAAADCERMPVLIIAMLTLISKMQEVTSKEPIEVEDAHGEPHDAAPTATGRLAIIIYAGGKAVPQKNMNSQFHKVFKMPKMGKLGASSWS